MSENREQICRVLTEEILEDTWHDLKENPAYLYDPKAPHAICSCGGDIYWGRHTNRTFSDRNQLGELYDKIQETNSWSEFEYFAWKLWTKQGTENIINASLTFPRWLFDPARAFDTVYPWWEGRKK